jgi:hypothetical protein
MNAYNGVLEYYHLPDYDSKFYWVIVIISGTLGPIYGKFLIYFMEFLLWSASFSIFILVWKAYKLFLRKVSFDLKQVHL